MSISSEKGKSIIILMFYFLIFMLLHLPHISCLVLASDLDPSSNLIENDNKDHAPLIEDDYQTNPDVNLVRKQQQQLEKLEELVKNLTKLVSQLEAKFSEIPEKFEKLPLVSTDDEKREVEKTKEGLTGIEKVPSGEGLRTVSVTKYSSFWSERFQFVSAVKLGSSPSCINVLPFRDFEGLSKYVAVGDDKGKVYVFLRNGDVSVEFDALSDLQLQSSMITSMVSYLSVYKNESIIVSGYESGLVFMHRVWEVSNSDEFSSLHVEMVGRFEISGGGRSRINVLEVHHVGRKRYILAIDGSGKITVFREDGTVYGSAVPSRQPLAFLKQRLLFLTETGAGSLDLRTMKLKESQCEGLNNSIAKNFVFDAIDRSKAYGFTQEGELIHTLLMGDIVNFKCRIRSKRKMDLDEPLALHAMKGYLLIANQEKIFLYNLSSQHYVWAGGLRLSFSVGLDEIISSFLNQKVVDVLDEKRMAIPLLTSDYEKFVILSLGNGYVAIYRSNLPSIKSEFNNILWTSPVLFFILFLFGAWQFFANKKEALTSWGPDDPFSSTSVMNGAPLALGTGERSFMDSSRNVEIMDLRGSSLRPSSRRFSPPRYSGGSAGPYRPSSDADSRPSSIDPRFRTPSELKFRGSSIETTIVPKRREGLYVNSQGINDSN
ncbi:uncharacterized membrane protein At1g75140-like [Olea europaea var. sylvestris]|uniref:uncharacterized membrane protein At1g75140-like n=1 Tax=Olea europaea var. sylvestris TaxID=158386 RepID=UPI000C1CFDDA|nr:uncharacterized membrane protein At1g75140-like [Olea europaea var. sylvestris]